MINKEVKDRIEQLSDLLAYAQAYDYQVLCDLHSWFNHVFRQSCFGAKIEMAAISSASAKIVEGMLIDNFCGEGKTIRSAAAAAVSNKECIRLRLMKEVEIALAQSLEYKKKSNNAVLKNRDEHYFSNQKIVASMR